MISISEVSYHGLMGSNREIAFPRTGVVLITGPNGAGKSTIIESIAHGVWGKSLRGSPGWCAGTTVVFVRSHDQFEVLRYRNGQTGKTKLQWGGVGGDRTCQTPSKTQVRIDSKFGTFDVWRRSCVVTQIETARFTLATDAERKKFLETLLDLLQFEEALRAARKDLRREEQDLAAIQQKLKVEDARLSGACRLLDELRDVARRVADPVSGPVEDVGGIRVRQKEIEVRAKEAKGQLAELTRAANKLTTEAGVASRRATLLGTACCPMCEQEISGSTYGDIKEELRRADELRERASDLRSTAAKLEEALEAGRVDWAVLGDRVSRTEAFAKMQESEYARFVKAREEEAGKIIEAEKEVDEVVTRREELIAESLAAEVRVRTLEVVVEILGLRGVRNQILTEALVAIETATNAWLERLGGSAYAVKLASQKTNKDGGVADAISLAVSTYRFPSWHPFEACSRGEQTRIDVAVGFALAEVAQARSGAVGGTLFIDEVFDALDDEGVDCACEVIREVAKDRCVVVISHNAHLKKFLQPDRHVALQ